MPIFYFLGCYFFVGMFALPFWVSRASGSEPLFGYVYTTDLLPQGHWELEQWATDREGQAAGRFHHLDLRSEIEYGLTDRFQASLYVNTLLANESGNSVARKTEGIEIPYDHDPSQPYVAGRLEGFSAEFVYRILSPYLDPLGAAFYVEPEWGPTDEGLEARAIIQKNLLDDQLVLGLNYWVELEREQSSNLMASTESWSNMTMAEWDLGSSYRIASNWSVGLEFRNHNEFRGYSLSHATQDHTAFFVGPNVHYGSEHWFFTFSVVRQIHAVAYVDDQRAQIQDGRLYGDEHTSWDGIRLKVGLPL